MRLFIMTLALFVLISLASSFETFSEPVQQSSLDLPADLKPFEVVRVLILKKKKQITIDADSPFVVFDGNNQFLFRQEKISNASVQMKIDGIQFGSQIVQATPLVIQSQGQGVKVNGHTYRQGIALWPDENQTIKVVNLLRLEDYLRGVLPWEANPVWNEEALKAQAIVSRTYALFMALERYQEPYDLSGDIDSQVYRGQRIENERTDQAIKSTEGKILIFDNKIFPAFFHSTCGGNTTTAHSLWDKRDHPAMQGVLCEFCQNSKHYQWENTFSIPMIIELLHTKGYSVKNIVGLDAIDIDASGRAQNFLFRTPTSSFKIKAGDFRIWLDPGKFKSTKIEKIEILGENIKFTGKGWGHGVGLCQYGMKYMAEMGYNYQQILSYYFPGSQIAQTEI